MNNDNSIENTLPYTITEIDEIWEKAYRMGQQSGISYLGSKLVNHLSLHNNGLVHIIELIRLIEKEFDNEVKL